MVGKFDWSFLQGPVNPIREENFPKEKEDVNKICEKVNRNESTRTPREPMVDHIFNNLTHINKMLKRNDLTVDEKSGLVTLISKGGLKNGRAFKAISFASKYCSYFNWGFPKYDGVLCKFLNKPEIREITKSQKIREQDYITFLSAITALHAYLSEQKLIDKEMTLEELDFHIWENETREDDEISDES